MLTLWDLIEPVLKLRQKRRGRSKDVLPLTPPTPVSPVTPVTPSSVAPAPSAASGRRSRGGGKDGTTRGRGKSRRTVAVAQEAAADGKAAIAMRSTSPATEAESAQERYDRVVQMLLREHGIRVRKWRSNMSGIAWYVTYRDGSITRLIETPKPKGPMSMAIFLHEVGHHAIGFNRYKPRCLEEYHAWAWAIAQMEAHGLNITEGVRYRMSASLWYAVSKAQRRGLKNVPAELMPYMTRPPKPRGRGGRGGSRGGEE